MSGLLPGGMRPKNKLCRLGFVLVLLFGLPGTAPAQPIAKKIAVLFDTDIGHDIDDPFALAWLVASPEIDLRGVTTVGTQAEDRAWLVCRFLTQTGHRQIPVAFGQAPQPKVDFDWQIQYRRHPAPIFHRTSKPAQEPAPEFLHQRLKESEQPVVIVAGGPLTNIARLLKDHPDSKAKIDRIIMTTARITELGGRPEPVADNVSADPEAVRTVLSAGVPVLIANRAKTRATLLPGSQQELFQACTPLTLHLQSLFQLWEGKAPQLVETFAAIQGTTRKLDTFPARAVSLGLQGDLVAQPTAVKPNVRILDGVPSSEFVANYVKVVAAGEAVLPRPPGNRSKLIEDNRFPTRVHCTEDYETDIEKRWWMCGKLETLNTPPGRGRCCRAVLTQDFDDRQGDMKTMYNAVIFNPVPGPPMGQNPRLRFRYWLKGTDTLRVQIYSLTKGYHRYLSLQGLPQEKWQLATVDMTQVRRPDGTGGPLSENERIDDVQFYVDPRAELLIDDIVLYDAGPEEETRSFPDRVHFTGIFDTGKQGQEWPGEFDIVDKLGFFWRAARSRINPEQPEHYLRVQLRGDRPLDATTRLFFRYLLHGGDRLKVILKHSASHKSYVTTIRSLERGNWARLDLEMNIPGRRADEIIFLIPRGGLLVDDLLLYTPGKE